jgi:hypothetical protein
MLNILLYIDPGTGSLLFQLILSGIISILFYFKKIIGFFKIKAKDVRNKDNIIDKNDN